MSKYDAKNYTKEYIIEAIGRAEYPTVKSLREQLHCGYDTARNYVKRWAETRQAMIDKMEAELDKAEKKVFDSVDDDVVTAKWLLSTKGKHRGYNERTEIDTKSEVVIRYSKEFDGI